MNKYMVIIAALSISSPIHAALKPTLEGKASAYRLGIPSWTYAPRTPQATITRGQILAQLGRYPIVDNQSAEAIYVSYADQEIEVEPYTQKSIPTVPFYIDGIAFESDACIDEHGAVRACIIDR